MLVFVFCFSHLWGRNLKDTLCQLLFVVVVSFLEKVKQKMLWISLLFSYRNNFKIGGYIDVNKYFSWNPQSAFSFSKGISSLLDTSIVFNFRIFLNILTTVVFTFPKPGSLLSPFFYSEIYFSVAGMRQKRKLPLDQHQHISTKLLIKVQKKEMKNKKGNSCNSSTAIVDFFLGNQKPSLKNIYGGFKVWAAFQQNTEYKTFIKEV